MRHLRHWLAAGFVLTCLASCSGKKTESKTEPRVAESLPPSPEKLDTPAPDTFRVKFETSKGDFIVEVHKEWAPIGAKRFYDAVKAGFYDDCRFFRVVTGFVVQWGINGDPKVQKRWRESPINDDPRVVSNTLGTITFAKPNAPNSRTAQVFINLKDNPNLDAQRGFPPFGKVIQGMDVVYTLNPEYGERPSGDQGRIQSQGNEYLNKVYPRLDYIKKATILKDGDTGTPKAKDKTSAKKSAEKKSPKKKSAEKKSPEKKTPEKKSAKTKSPEKKPGKTKKKP